MPIHSSVQRDKMSFASSMLWLQKLSWQRQFVVHNILYLYLYGISNIDLTRHRFAHLVTKSPPFTHSVPLLHSLHWLPVRFKILFKINLLTFKTLREKQPFYLHSMLAASLPSRLLRSNNDNSLSVPSVTTNTSDLDEHRRKSFPF